MKVKIVIVEVKQEEKRLKAVKVVVFAVVHEKF
jgi:hypothetical protein